MASGAPVVRPSNRPETIATRSGSRRWVVKRERPGRRRSSQRCTQASSSARRGGTPSTTQPICGPWLSPQVVTRKRWPKPLEAMAAPPALLVNPAQHGGVLILFRPQHGGVLLCRQTTEMSGAFGFFMPTM